MKERLIRTVLAAGIVSVGVTAMSAWTAAQDKSTKPAVAAPSAKEESGPIVFEVDPVHSAALFKIRHMEVSNFHGGFKMIKGTALIDPADLSTAKFDVQVPITSVDTKAQPLTEHLQSDEFFDAVKYPVMSFKSTGVKVKDKNTLEVTGDFSLHGVTKSITVNMDVIAIKNTQFMGLRAGFETVFSIKRSDYKMDYGVSSGAIGDEVEITVALEMGKPEPEHQE
ncbi:MAG TPA: YceI family protein [Phycisphaerales bacterium]|nr:YceI family protein [Phycisphaerales bacterium]